ncbi:unnamed protein product [Danaus chrysippus]|uniref:(African queen) hypothetical protein n=1 Tax=Danaus chrysippus TaxID=151541 RepID=A0A8J2QL40_9NEOP|nr:unnamed protein product [Danaus chrysippus]
MADVLEGETNKNPSDPKYYALAQESLEKYQVLTGQINLVVTVVTRVTEQVVAGVITRLHFTAQPLDQIYFLMCNSKILVPLDSSQKQITVDCEMAHIDGGIVVKDPNDPKYYALAQESLDKYQEQTGQRNLLVIKVTKATEQLVAGLITRLQFNAQPLGVLNMLSCNSEIYEPVDLSPKEITVDCESL